LKWIADLRDPWTDIYYYKEFFPTLPARMADRRYERAVVEGADNIISVGKGLAEMFTSRYPSSVNKFTVIANGYDGADFAGLTPSKPETFTISYVGTLSGAYNISGLTTALKHLEENGAEFIVRFTGFVSDDQKALFAKTLPPGKLVFRDYCTHSEAITEMLQSSLLLLLIPEHASSKVILTGKLFEYIATGKPILCIGPTDGDAAETLSGFPNCRAADYSDSKLIEQFIEDAISNRLPEREYMPEEFSREEGARKLKEIL
jgi:glycosyltransferase involved in cell wall biosynthesis